MNTENCQELNHLHVAQDHSKFHQPKVRKEREEDFHQLREKQTKSAVHFVKIMPTTHWWSLKWGGHLRESHHSGCLPRRSHNTSTFRQKIYCKLFLGCSMFTRSSMLSWKIYSWFATTWQGGHVGAENKRIFPWRICMKIVFSSQRREMLLFLTTNMAAVTSSANQQYSERCSTYSKQRDHIMCQWLLLRG